MSRRLSIVAVILGIGVWSPAAIAASGIHKIRRVVIIMQENRSGPISTSGGSTG